MAVGKILIVYAYIVQGEPVVTIDQLTAPIGIDVDDIKTTCARYGEEWMKKDELNNVAFKCIEIKKQREL